MFGQETYGGSVTASSGCDGVAGIGKYYIGVETPQGESIPASEMPQGLCVPRISSTALTSRVALPAVRP